jgi:hypothetical protein
MQAERRRPRPLHIAGCLVVTLAALVLVASLWLFRLMAAPAATLRVENRRPEAVVAAYRACNVADQCWEGTLQVPARSSRNIPEAVLRENVTVRVTTADGRLVLERLLPWSELEEARSRVTVSVE